MRERDREIKRRRQRYQKRKRLRQQLAATTAEAERQKIVARKKIGWCPNFGTASSSERLGDRASR
ncbi:MAG: hypothetical protein DMF60_03285 [Acidobacteria bacterium]|nr:MAG: hypothetical protein DMF60_03285 [Acidobacteriota bacterium]